tara:strand:+ start:6858 stop:7034 length:177 start_codon:yes stop_codon:yes gene_type:complete
MRLLTVQDLIDIQQAEQPLQEPTAVAKATGKTLDEVLEMPASEYMKCRQQVLETNGLG